MSERSDADVERLVEAQARGEQPSGVNAEGAAGQGAELDTRRSKSAFGFSAIGAADTVVDVGGAEVDTDQYIMQQGGPAIQHGMAGGPMNLSAGGGIVPTMYPDQVDDPAWIDAHGRGAGLDGGVGLAAGEGTVAQYDQSTSASIGTRDVNQFPDAVDDPEYIRAQAEAGTSGIGVAQAPTQDEA
jgi:hypothetical protein